MSVRRPLFVAEAATASARRRLHLAGAAAASARRRLHLAGAAAVSARRQLLLVGVPAVAVAVFLVTVPTFRHFFDLGVYRGAVHWWLIDGGSLYDFRYQGTEYGFTYPPFAALLFSPLAVTPWPLAVAAALAVNAAMVVLLLRWFLVPVLRRHGRAVGTPCALAFLAILVFEPARDTFSFGQVNLVLLVLVCADLRALERGRPGPSPTGRPARRLAGVGIGLAAAIKLTPAVFLGYLLITRQYRAAATASATALGVTALTFLVAPDASDTFWTSALADTGRVGKLDYVSNQSLRGVVARLDAPVTAWIVGVAVALVLWFWAVRATDRRTGFALTALLACLISPITWVHHLVWLLPAFFVLLDRTFPSVRGLAALGAAYFVLSSSLVWLWWAHPHGWSSFAGSNAYVWTTLALAAALATGPARRLSATCAAGWWFRRGPNVFAPGRTARSSAPGRSHGSG